MMKKIYVLLLFIATLTQPAAAALIVDRGTPQAEIVVAADPPRMVALAAMELQHTIEAISGARLPIVTKRDPSVPVALFVGESRYTNELDIDCSNLPYGAYRIRSGPNWLALVGDDYDYSPPKPSAMKRNEQAEKQAEWDELTAEHTEYAWGFPFSNTFKNHWYGSEERAAEMRQRYGAENEYLWTDGSFTSGLWLQDDGGSLNAVYAFLEDLGVRWFLPGELGEVLPVQETIELPEIDVTVEPDYKMRAWTWYNYSGFPFEEMLWGRRLGLNSAYEILGELGYAHGHVHVHKREEMRQARPDMYALIGNYRDTDHRNHGTPCYSSEQLYQETVNFARFMFDEYDQPHVSIWPTDGFKRCQCEDCEGKSASELVWGFVNRVATELYKTHPDRLVSCGAYTMYSEPPESIDQFSPNVAVFISNEGRPAMIDDTHWQRYVDRVERWNQRLAPGRVFRVENNLYSVARGRKGEPDPFPVPQGRAIARDLQGMKGTVIGEHSEQSQARMRIVNPAMTHLPLYVQAQYFWDADQDYDALMDDYYTNFFGPVAEQMRDAWAFAEQAYIDAVRDSGGKKPTSLDNVPYADRIAFVEMVLAAREDAGDSVYGERVQLVIDGLTPLEELRAAALAEELAGNIRENNPLVTAVPTGSAENPTVYRLKDNVSGGEPDVETTFSVHWDEQGALILDVRCEEPDMANLASTPDVWTGDTVALLIETPGLSYYHIEVNPDGLIYDSDMGGGVRARWQSLATVETDRGADFWSVRIRLPVVGDAEGQADPNHRMVGGRPEADEPWYINVGRQRVRDAQSTTYLFNPTGEKGYHKTDKFARLIVSEN